jgi:hypothetical protein
LTGLVNDWHVLDEESASDHKYINFNISAAIDSLKYKSTVKYVTKNANWSQLKSDFTPKMQSIKNKIISANNVNELNFCVISLTNEITKSCNKCLKKVITMSNKKSNKWWTQELTEMRAKSNQLRRRYQRCRQTDRRVVLKNEYYSHMNVYKKTINETKIKSWNEFVSDNSRENPWGVVSKIARNKINREVITELKTTDGRLLTDSEDIANHLMDSLFPDDQQIPDLEVHQNLKTRLNLLNN